MATNADRTGPLAITKMRALLTRNRWVSGRTLMLLGCLWLSRVEAFLATPSGLSGHNNVLSSTWSDPTGTQLDMAKRRGNLGSIADAGESVAKTSRTVPKKRSKRVSKKNTGAGSNKKEEASTISPLLQEWASGQQPTTEDLQEEVTTNSASSFSRFDDDDNKKKTRTSKKKKNKKEKSVKREQDEQRQELVLELVQQLEEVLEDSKENNQKTNDMNDILNPIRQLLALPNANTNLRQLIAGNSRYDYRLTWVGSDSAICHVGTGLHNVPLARLQEVFLSCVGKSRLEVLEVIRIIGPFPNVRNTLEGSCKIGKRNLIYGDEDDNDVETTVSELGITYDSMIDGTGKQITAGMEDNVRRLNLHIAFCDENAIVAVVPPEDGSVRQDPLEDNGANILFFAREDTLDEKLDALRVL